MGEFLKTLLSLSLSGSAVALLLLVLHKIFRNTVSNRWRYYIWIILFVRLLLPITFPESPVGTLFTAPSTDSNTVPNTTSVFQEAEESTMPVASVAVPKSDPPAIPLPQVSGPIVLFAFWGVTALLRLVHKATQYQSFTRYLRAGSRPVADPAVLNRYGEVCTFVQVINPPELRTSSLVTTPMLVGIRKPYIVLPDSVGDCAMEKILMHELLHHKHYDVLYKWFAQAVLCLHWFNPIIWFAVRAMEQDCELACDENVLHIIQPEEQRNYGNALLQVVRIEGGYRSEVASLALSENAKQLKERLEMIMKFRKRTRIEKALTACLTVALCIGSIAVGAYAVEAPFAHASSTKTNTASSSSSVPQEQDTTVNVNKEDASTPDGSLKFAMQAIKELDIDTLCRYSNNRKTAYLHALYSSSNKWDDSTPSLFGGYNAKKDELYQELVRSLTWKIEKASVLGDTAKLILTTTNRNFGGVMAEVISQAFLDTASEEDRKPYDRNTGDMFPLTKAVPDNKTVTLTVTVEMRKTNGVWQLQIDDKFANAVCGNLFDGVNSVESKAKIDLASKSLEEFVRKSIDWDAISQEVEASIKQSHAEIEQQLQDTMEEINIEKEVLDAMKDAFH